MAITQNNFTGNGSTVLFSFTFPYLDSTDILVSVNGTLTTAYTLANATTIQFTTAPANGAAVRIYRVTDDDQLATSFLPGSAIRSQDLNESFTQGIYIAQEATRDVAAATAQVSSAVTTANTASTNAAAAVSTANTAASNATTAVSTANTALTTANTAASNASSAVTTANSASSAATAATGTANTAASNASAAVSTANTASTNASTALSTANTAASNASTAVSTANTAAGNASTALSTANTALSNSSTALTTANTADVKADAAIAAVASSVDYTAIADVASIPGSPANNTYIEVLNATGLESYTPLAGMPVGFVGDSGLKARLRYTTAGSTWNWIDYAPTNPDGRYVNKTSISSSVTSTSTTTVANSAAVKVAKDAADTASTSAAAAQSTANTGVSDAASAQATANTAVSNAAAAQSSATNAQSTASSALPKAGGTMTGLITFDGAQTFPGSVTTVSGTSPISVTAGTTPTVSVSAATTGASGVVQLSDSTSSTSSSTAATSAAVKAVQDFAQVVSTTANAAMPKAGGTFTGNITVPSINSGPLAGFRNAIINGNFDIWQRGTSFTGSEYGADRWYQVRVGTTHTGTRQSFTLGQTAVPGEPKYFCRTVVTSVAGAANQSLLQQRIEDVRTFAGQQVTVSFWAKVDATKNISVEFAQVFGSGGTPSALVPAIGTTKVSIGTSWQKVTVTATVPSISGKTLGTSNDSTLNLNLWFDAGSSFNSRTDTLGQQSGTFDIAQVQIEAGPVATPFERRPIGTELELCLRYYQIVADSAAFGTSNTTTACLLKYVFPVPMRASPTRTLSTGSTITIDFFGYGQSTSTTISLFSTEQYLGVNVSLLSPARTAFIPVAIVGRIFASAEL